MAQEWHELTRLTQGEPIQIERIRIIDSNIAIDGKFDLPPLARLSSEDQIFIIAFVLCHGSIKDMERIFGISYPTVKNRLDRLSKQFQLVESLPHHTQNEILSDLGSGEISATEAIERLSK